MDIPQLDGASLRRGADRAALLAYRNALRPVLFQSNGGDAEKIHEQMIHALGMVPAPVSRAAAKVVRVADPVEVAGISFPSRVGVAAGLDKNGIAARAWAGLGFGFAELGTVTAEPQPGNEKPRVFRARKSQGIVNRMGFNNDGAQALADRLTGWGVRRGNGALGLPIGISIGKNKVVELDGAVENYLASFDLLAPLADYVAVNVSSPNTPGLRQLQDGDQLRDLTRALVGRARELTPDNPVPVFVKLAPDLGTEALYEAIGVCELAGVSGLVATNTTLSRDGLAADDRWLANEAGGLSGKPLTTKALRVVEQIVRHTDLPVIGAGGIMKPADAHAMLDAGAQLVQVYTGFIYSGPALVTGIGGSAR